MPEKLCKICGKIPTTHPSGTCVMCMINGALPSQASQREMQQAVIPTTSARHSSVSEIALKKDVPKTCRDMTDKKQKKEEVMSVTEKNKGRKCSVEDCFKYAVKDGCCITHFNEAHGIVKRIGRKPSGKKYKYTCEVEGCEKGQWKNKRCMVHWKEKHSAPFKKKSQASLQSPKKAIECKSASRGKVAEPESILVVDTHVEIDLSSFPKINKFVSALPEISASDMLGVLLKGRLNELEERIAI